MAVDSPYGTRPRTADQVLDDEGDRLIAAALGRHQGDPYSMAGLSSNTVTKPLAEWSHGRIAQFPLREDLDGPARPCLASLALIEIAEVMNGAGLTERQRTVVARRVAGGTWEQIGNADGITKQGAMNIFVQAMKKISRIVEAGRMLGLAQAYREDVSRGSRRRPARGIAR